MIDAIDLKIDEDRSSTINHSQPLIFFLAYTDDIHPAVSYCRAVAFHRTYTLKRKRNFHHHTISVSVLQVTNNAPNEMLVGRETKN